MFPKLSGVSQQMPVNENTGIPLAPLPDEFFSKKEKKNEMEVLAYSTNASF